MENGVQKNLVNITLFQWFLTFLYHQHNMIIFMYHLVKLTFFFCLSKIHTEYFDLHDVSKLILLGSTKL